MKRIPFLIAIVLLLAGCHPSDFKIIEPTHWQFEHKGEWFEATVPGCIHTDLMAHDIIPDPFYGTNEDSVQ